MKRAPSRICDSAPARSLAVGIAMLFAVGGSGCSREEAPPTLSAPPAPPAVPEVPAVPVIEYGAESVEAFKRRLATAFANKDYETYRQLHCWEKLPSNMRAALSGAAQNKALKVFDFPYETIEVEPMTKQDLEQARAGKWDIAPSSWVIVQGAVRRQFKHWALGQHEGRYYLATRLN